ncbi:hypothetical protein GDO78_012367 [Eleutherodactylus coqui]|uniref:Uncharacterized protein n=1 Tax=Eleutherodactylus coqui TaxID=57060 RepID=A0A8J6EZJ5_ELECQ|nr:hypothetical protein GDO78_012367 [Eleutherodactylus coqui]
MFSKVQSPSFKGSSSLVNSLVRHVVVMERGPLILCSDSPLRWTLFNHLLKGHNVKHKDSANPYPLVVGQF